MIHVTRQTLWPVLAFGMALATPALAQAPSDAQRQAIKSNCRSDYMAHCSSISPGGAAALQCLQQNMASLSAACAGAVKAVSAPAETKSEPAAAKEESAKETRSEPAAAPPKTAAEPAKTEPAKTESAKTESTKTESTKTESTRTEPAKTSIKAAGTSGGKPSSAQIDAVRSNCRSDYPKVCAGVPTGGAPALQCLEKNKAKLSPACEKAVAAASGGAAEPAAARGGGSSATANASPSAGPAAPPPPTAIVLRPMLPREILFVLRSACGADVRTLCATVPPGGGRIIECLATQPASLSPECRDVLGQFAAQ
jgi:hypothetical protein